MGIALEIGFGFGNASRTGGTLLGLGNSSLGVRGGNSSLGVSGLTWDDELAEGAAISSLRLRCRI